MDEWTGKLWYIQTMENYLVMGRSELVKKSWRRKQCILQMKEARLKGSIFYDSHYDILENRTTESRNIRGCQGISKVGGMGKEMDSWHTEHF